MFVTTTPITWTHLDRTFNIPAGTPLEEAAPGRFYVPSLGFEIDPSPWEVQSEEESLGTGWLGLRARWFRAQQNAS